MREKDAPHPPASREDANGTKPNAMKKAPIPHGTDAFFQNSRQGPAMLVGHALVRHAHLEQAAQMLGKLSTAALFVIGTHIYNLNI